MSCIWENEGTESDGVTSVKVTFFHHFDECPLKSSGACCKYANLPCFTLKILSVVFPK